MREPTEKATSLEIDGCLSVAVVVVGSAVVVGVSM
jgi:hypothetical protein